MAKFNFSVSYGDQYIANAVEVDEDTTSEDIMELIEEAVDFIDLDSDVDDEDE